MAGPFAASLGAIAMATAIFRGVVFGESADACIVSGLGWLLAFSVIGWIAGGTMDYLVRQDIEQQYRRRLDEFRKEIESFSDTATTSASDQ